MHLYVCVCTNVCVCMYVDVCMCAYMWMYVCMGIYGCMYILCMGFPDGSMVKNLPAMQENTGSIPVSGRSSRRGNGNPLQYSSLVGYSPKGHKKSDMTERLSTHILCMHVCIGVDR